MLRCTGLDIPYPPARLEEAHLPGVDGSSGPSSVPWTSSAGGWTRCPSASSSPDLGEGLTEGEVVRWLVAAGDAITLNQPIVEVETAKAVVEIPAPYAGTVVKLHAGEGDTWTSGPP